MEGQLFRALRLSEDKKAIQDFSSSVGIPVKRLVYLNRNNKLPDTFELDLISKHSGINQIEVMLSMGIYNHSLIDLLKKNKDAISSILNAKSFERKESNAVEPVFSTSLGNLYKGDCIDILKNTDSNSIDLIFADPPFNLDKFYASNMDDNLPENQYLKWCEDWIEECVRVLKDGGSFFLWNIPKWHIILSKFLDDRLTFRNWIATDIKFSLPIQGKLYPSHYSLLYFVKGDKPNCFKPDRLPMEVCKSCFRELKDYGGYKNKMNPNGINLSDVWYDIPPVRHSKYKKRKEANELSIKLLDRIIEMSSNEGDIIFDPFGGSGTTYIVAELKKRRWLGVELGPVEGIMDRFNSISEEDQYLKTLRLNYNRLFTKEVKTQRIKKGIWVEETFHTLFDDENT